MKVALRTTYFLGFPTYLKQGTALQQAALQTLEDSQLFKRLAAFKPTLCGTIPLAINTSSSDLDIICQSDRPEVVAAVLKQHYTQKKGFTLYTKSFNAKESLVCRFILPSFEIEVFVQDTPVTEQMAYRHMLIEDAILRQNDAHFRESVIALKEKGIKTEPAFAQLLKLDGDPYEALLGYEKA